LRILAVNGSPRGQREIPGVLSQAFLSGRQRRRGRYGPDLTTNVDAYASNVNRMWDAVLSGKIPFNLD